MNHMYEDALREAITTSINVRWTLATRVGYAALEHTSCPLCALAAKVRRESRIPPGDMEIPIHFFCPIYDGDAYECCKEYKAFSYAFCFETLQDQQQCARAMIRRLQEIDIPVWSRQLYEKILSLQGVWHVDASDGGDDAD